MRTNTLRLSLPSLNDRPDDVLYLFSYFLQSFRHRQVSLPKILKKALIQHDWWGNIRELHSVALRYYIFGDTLNGAYDSLFDIPDENRKESLLDTASLQLDMKHLERRSSRYSSESCKKKAIARRISPNCSTYHARQFSIRCTNNASPTTGGYGCWGYSASAGVWLLSAGPRKSGPTKPGTQTGPGPNKDGFCLHWR